MWVVVLRVLGNTFDQQSIRTSQKEEIITYDGHTAAKTIGTLIQEDSVLSGPSTITWR